MNRRGAYHLQMVRPGSGDDWLALTELPLPVEEALQWAVRPDCGAVVLFSGTVRDHAEGRSGVTSLDYEAYAQHVVPRLGVIAAEARVRWPTMGRVALLHRVGNVELAESSVVVVVSAPHRGEAFDAARYCIDTLKATAPIWKKEHHAEGSDWATGSTPVERVARGTAS